MSDQIDWVHRSIIVTADNVLLARYVAGQLGPSSQGMFTAALQPIGPDVAEPTHFISAGLMDRVFANMLASPAALVDGALAMGVSVPSALAERLLGTTDVSEDDGLAACARLGLRHYTVEVQALTDMDEEPLGTDNEVFAGV